MVVRAKFKLDEQKNFSSGKVDGKSLILTDFKFNAVVNDNCEENKLFWKWTPAGQIMLSSVNPEVLKYFEIGKEYYVDFIEVP